MSMLGLYRSGRTPIHRCPAGVKLLVLAGALVATLRWPVAALVPTVALYAVARIPWRVALAQVRPLWLMFAVTAGFQAFAVGVPRAIEITCGLLVSFALAALVTLTTRVEAMLDVIARALRPLRFVGVDPDRVALLLAMTIRCVPLLAEIISTVREAQRARGAVGHPMALAVPAVVRALRAADALGEALTARGLDD